MVDQPASPANVTDHDCHRVADLIGQTYGITSSHEARIRHLLEGTVQLLNATAAVCVIAENVTARRPRVRTAIDVGWNGQMRRDQGLDAATRLAERGQYPLLDRMLTLRDRIVTQRRVDLIGDEEWHASRFYQQAHRDAGVGECMLSWSFLDEEEGLKDTIVTLDLLRPAGAPAFSARERNVLHLLHIAMRPALHAYVRAQGDPRLRQLRPRAREVLDLLLQGLSERDIADQLRRSPHTVHNHIRYLYRSFSVNSRAELLSQFTQRATL